MKNVIALLAVFFICCGINSYSQTLNFKDIGAEKPDNKFDQYVSKDGFIYKKGDTLTIGKGTGVNGSYIHLTTMNYKPDASIYNTKVIIDYLTITGNKKAGWKIGIVTKGSFKQDALYFNIEDALATGELKPSGMTSDEALTELKRYKDKLDLGLITQDEFDKKKAELSKYIK